MMELITSINIQEIVGNVWYVILIFICTDIITGLLASAKEGQLSSKINYDGIIRKVGELVGLGFITFLDAYFSANGRLIQIMSGMIIVYEAMSIIENFSRIGIDMTWLTKFFKNKDDDQQ